MAYNDNTYTGPSFSLRNRILRAIWNIFYVIFFKFSPKPFHSWRSFLLRLFNAKVGKGVHIYPGVKIWAPWNLELEDECCVANGAILYSQNKIFLGQRSIISQGVHICTGTHDYTKKGHPLISFPIYIGAKSWIAAEAFIHPGISIGEGTVIGARAVVTKNMPPWMICSGNPCRPIKERIITES